MEFFPDYEPTEKVFAYGVFGGVPHYLQAVDDTQSLGENITRTLLQQQGSLHEEPEHILRMEIDEVNRFFAILEAIAKGNRTRNDIAGDAGIDTNSSSYYLDRLEDLKLIEPDYSLLGFATALKREVFSLYLYRPQYPSVVENRCTSAQGGCQCGQLHAKQGGPAMAVFGLSVLLLVDVPERFTPALLPSSSLRRRINQHAITVTAIVG